jgi:hypothetical protein
MKKITHVVAVVLTSTLLFSCGQADEKTEDVVEEQAQNTEVLQENEEEIEDNIPLVNTDSLVNAIDSYRGEIEANVGEGTEVSTEDMRAKIKQKWDKIHFYTMEGNVVRIKTYPYENVSKRTEEFYLKDGNLVLSVIEDNGAGERGKGNESIDKIYYYHNDEMIKEVNGEERAEYSIKQSDAEELLSEVKEYLDAYNDKSKM